MMPEPQLSAHTSSRQPSAIRVASIEFAARTDDTQAVNVAIGNVSLPMHPRMQKALSAAGTAEGEFSDGVVRYTPTVGTDGARTAVKKILKATLKGPQKDKVDNLHVQITDGGSQAMELMILACCGAAGTDDRPLFIIDAAYTNYLAFAARLGRKVVSLRRYLTPDGNFPLPDQDQLRAAFAKYKPGAVVIIPYDNPTGCLYRNDDLKKLAELCVEFNCWLVSDEAYRELHYPQEDAPSVWSLSNADVDGIEGRRIGIETASKVWNACGLRIGALVTDNLTLHQQCVAENTASLCPSALGQSIFAALGQESESQLQQWFAQQREYYKALVHQFHRDMKQSLPGAIVSQPEASLYSVVDVAPLVGESFRALDFVMWCAQKGRVETADGAKTLLTAPMEGFYDRSTNPENTGRTQFRFAFVESPEAMAEVPQLFAELFRQYLAENVGHQAVYGQQVLGLIRKLTEADGDVTRNERSWLRLLKREFGAENAPDARFDPEVLKATIQDAGEAKELVQLLLMVSLSDGQTTPEEWSLIQEVAGLVNIERSQLEELRSETVLAVEP